MMMRALCTQGALGGTGASEAPTARPTGFDVDVGGPGLLRAPGGGPKLGQITIENKVCRGGEESAANKAPWQLQESEDDHGTCLLAKLSMA